VLSLLDIAAAYASSDDEDQQLIKNLALFLTNFLHTHLRLIENPENTELLINAHLYLIKISTVDDREVFKICLEYWGKLVAELYEECSAAEEHLRRDPLEPASGDD
jgi:exportin-1